MYVGYAFDYFLQFTRVNRVNRLRIEGKRRFMPATSKAQQATAGIALALKRHEIPASKAGPAAKSMAKMPTSTLLEYAKTKHGNLPDHVSKK